jgi:hypothetical protein
MTANSTWRVAAAVPTAVFMASFAVWTTVYGTPTNTLHTNAQGWGFFGLLAIVGTVLGSKALEALTKPP